MSRTAWALAALLIVGAGCGGGPDGTSVAPPTAPAPTPPPAPEPAPPPDPPIEITPVGRGISVTSENQILLELMPEDVVPANPVDLAGRTLMFTPDGRGGYSREVRALDWEEEADDAERMYEPVEVELEHFRFPFAGREWDSFFYTKLGLISFGEPIPSDHSWPKRFGTMPQMFDLFVIAPTISALYKPHLAGNVRVSNLPDRMIVTFFVYDLAFFVYGREPKESFDFQIVLHSDGRIALNYGPEPQDPDEAFGDGIVGVFPGSVKTGLLGSIPDSVDGSLPAHLDLVETALYAAARPDIVLVEFTTRGPIRPIPNEESVYMVAIDDWDFVAGVTLRPDGSRRARWDAEAAYDRDVDDNRIGLLFDSGEFSGHSTSVRAFARSRNHVTGSWSPRYGEHSAVIRIPEAADPVSIDLSRPDPRPSAAQYEVFRYPMIRDGPEGVGHVSCRIIEVLGDHFDFMAFNSEFRVDQQGTGPAHGFAGFYDRNIQAEVTGIGPPAGGGTTPCESRLKNSWGFPVWMKAETVADESHAELPGQTPYDPGLTVFAHEMGHTWLARAQYMKDGKRRLMTTAGGGSHWAFGLHAPAPFSWWGAENGSVMGGSYWRENSDGTFTPTRAWWTQGGGFSWLDLYLMGLATPDEVPDMFILRNLQEAGDGWRGPYTGEKEIVTMEQIVAAMGPRNPPPERAPKVFNIGFVYFLLPGQEPDPELLREHVRYRDRALEHWRHVTGGRGQLSTELPGR